jgi:hypothetical protein
MKLNDLIPDIMIELPGCTERTVEHTLRHVLAAFIRRSKAWQFITTADAEECNPNIQLKGIGDALIESVVDLRVNCNPEERTGLINNAYHTPCSGAECGCGAGTTGGTIFSGCNSVSCGEIQSSEKISGAYFSCGTHGSIVLNSPYIPAITQKDYFIAKLFLSPSLHGETVPEYIIDECYSILIHATIRDLCISPKKPYTNMELGQIHAQKYRREMSFYTNKLNRKRTSESRGIKA